MAGQRYPFSKSRYFPRKRMRSADFIQDQEYIEGKGKVYALTGIWVKKWEVGELDALQNKLLIDQFELNYDYLYISE